MADLATPFSDMLWNAVIGIETEEIVDYRRSIQTGLAWKPLKVREGHPHPTAAAQRNTAAAVMATCATNLGLEPYIIQPSQREDASGLDGWCRHIALKNTVVPVRSDPITSKHCLIMTDADYEADMPFWVGLGQPILLYTFVPTRLAGGTGDAHYTIEHDKVLFTSNGGVSNMTHRLWDYNHDVMFVEVRSRQAADLREMLAERADNFWRDLRGTFTGKREFILAHVDHWALPGCADRRIIAITPYLRLYSRRCYLLTAGQELVRFSTSKQEWSRLEVLTDEGKVQVSLSKAGTEFSAEVEKADLEAAAMLFNDPSRRLKTPLHDVKQWLEVKDRKVAITVYTYLKETFEETRSLKKMVKVHQPGDFAKHYTVKRDDTGDVDFQDPKIYARRYASAPLMGLEAYFPTETDANEEDTIAKRVVEPNEVAEAKVRYLEPSVSTKRMRKEPQHRFHQYAREFVGYVVPKEKVGTGVPWDVTEVMEVQTRRLQKVRAETVKMHLKDKFRVGAFQKREAYSAPNNPRNISTVPTTHTLQLSAYTYPFKHDVLKDHEWYVPGKTPLEIARAVQRVCLQNVNRVALTDFSRMDATITRWMREHVEFACYLRWVKAEHFAELNTLLNDELNPKAWTKSGISYQPGCSRLSGSPLTTDGNTIVNRFSQYCTSREAGLTQEEAEELDSLCYGDDGLASGEINEECYIRTATFLGFTLKVDFAPFETPVSFLSRIFPNPWGSLASIQDPARTLAKLHTTTDAAADPLVAGIAKTTGYLVTDPKTPLIADWCNAYQRALMLNQAGDFVAVGIQATCIEDLQKEKESSELGDRPVRHIKWEQKHVDLFSYLTQPAGFDRKLMVIDAHTDGAVDKEVQKCLKQVLDANDLPWWVQIEGGISHPWPQSDVGTEVLEGLVASLLGVTGQDLKATIEELREHKGSDVMSLPQLAVKEDRTTKVNCNVLDPHMAGFSGELDLVKAESNLGSDQSTNTSNPASQDNGTLQDSTNERDERVSQRGGAAGKNKAKRGGAKPKGRRTRGGRLDSNRGNDPLPEGEAQGANQQGSGGGGGRQQPPTKAASADGCAGAGGGNPDGLQAGRASGENSPPVPADSVQAVAEFAGTGPDMPTPAPSDGERARGASAPRTPRHRSGPRGRGNSRPRGRGGWGGRGRGAYDGQQRNNVVQPSSGPGLRELPGRDDRESGANSSAEPGARVLVDQPGQGVRETSRGARAPSHGQGGINFRGGAGGGRGAARRGSANVRGGRGNSARSYRRHDGGRGTYRGNNGHPSRGGRGQ